MPRPRVVRVPRSASQIADSVDLRSVIRDALAAAPVDEAMLRRGVWTYVGAERDAGTRPGHVIMALTNLMDDAPITAVVERQALTRRVILWGVEAYSGHLGGDGVGLADASIALSDQ